MHNATVKSENLRFKFKLIHCKEELRYIGLQPYIGPISVIDLLHQVIGRHGGVCWAVCVDVYKVMQGCRRFGTNRVEIHEVKVPRKATKDFFSCFARKLENAKMIEKDVFLVFD